MGRLVWVAFLILGLGAAGCAEAVQRAKAKSARAHSLTKPVSEPRGYVQGQLNGQVSASVPETVLASRRALTHMGMLESHGAVFGNSGLVTAYTPDGGRVFIEIKRLDPKVSRFGVRLTHQRSPTLLAAIGRRIEWFAKHDELPTTSSSQPQADPAWTGDPDDDNGAHAPDGADKLF